MTPVRRPALTTRLARQVLEKAASRLGEGELLVEFPGGEEKSFGPGGDGSPHARLKIVDDEFYRRLLLDGEIGFGEAYMDGLFETDDLVSLIGLGIVNRRHVSLNGTALSWLSRQSHRWRHRRQKNTKAGSKANIHAHYDLSNEFFRLFLDDTITYSCALFRSADETLEQAQQNKHRLLLEKAGVKPGDHILEIGCGWGEFALTAARDFGCRVTTITISREQLPVVRQRVEEAGLSHLIDVQLCDYRDVTGQYDAILSTEVFEHIGAEFLESCFKKCESLLKPGGVISIQVLGVPDRGYPAARAGMHWMQKYIFPGSLTPSISVLERSLKSTNLLMTSVEDIGPQYPLTFREWRRRFHGNLPQIRQLGFDDRFIRMWEFYLATCEACYLTRHLSNLQVVLQRQRWGEPVYLGDRPPAMAMAR